MICVHFIGFRGDEYNSAIKVWGKPSFIHRYWDKRAEQEITPGDIAIFARKKDWDNIDNPNSFSFDDSAVL